MKKRINGHLYNTETAKEIIHYRSDRPVDDFYYVDEGLYNTKNGLYFLAGFGGAATRYATLDGDGQSYLEGKGIVPIDESEAYNWLTEHNFSDIDI